MKLSELPACFCHRFLNAPWNDRHRRALAYLAGVEYATARDIGQAAGRGLRGDGQPMDRLGASRHGGRIANDLHRLGFATIALSYRNASGYHKVTREGAAVVARGELRYAVERMSRERAP